MIFILSGKIHVSYSVILPIAIVKSINLCISYFTIGGIKFHNQDNSLKEGSSWTYGSKRIRVHNGSKNSMLRTPILNLDHKAERGNGVQGAEDLNSQTLPSVAYFL